MQEQPSHPGSRHAQDDGHNLKAELAKLAQDETAERWTCEDAKQSREASE